MRFELGVKREFIYGIIPTDLAYGVGVSHLQEIDYLPNELIE
jgi:hypothetical protein